MPKKILLADDSITIQKVISITFANEDYELVVVGDGDTALSRAREIKPDLVLADVAMPGKNGYEVCEAIKNDSALGNTPVMLLAGTFEPLNAALAEKVRADEHIVKPFESQDIIDKVKRLLERASSGAPAGDVSAKAEPVAKGAELPLEISDTIWDEGDFIGFADEFEDKPVEAAASPVTETAAPEEDFLDEKFFDEPKHDFHATNNSHFADLEFQEEEPGTEEPSSGAPATETAAAEPAEAGPVEEKPAEEPFDISGFDDVSFRETAEDRGDDIAAGFEESFMEDEPAGEEDFLLEATDTEPIPEAAGEGVVEEISSEDDFIEAPAEEQARPPAEESAAEPGFEASQSVGSAAEKGPDDADKSRFEPLRLVQEGSEGAPRPLEDLAEWAAEEVEERAAEELEKSVASQAAASAGGTAPQLPREELERIVARVAREVIEEIAWEVVPELSEQLILKEINKLKEALNRLK